jgi:hypothetical protein
MARTCEHGLKGICVVCKSNSSINQGRRNDRQKLRTDLVDMVKDRHNRKFQDAFQMMAGAL